MDSYMQQCQAQWAVPLQKYSSTWLISHLARPQEHASLQIYSLLTPCPPSFFHGMSVYLHEHHFLLISETFEPLKLKWISVFFIY